MLSSVKSVDFVVREIILFFFLVNVMTYIYCNWTYWSDINGSVQIVAPRKFSLVCFRLLSPQSDEDCANKLNRDLLDAANSTGKIYISHTVCSTSFYIFFLHQDLAWWFYLCFTTYCMRSEEYSFYLYFVPLRSHWSVISKNNAGFVKQIHIALRSWSSTDRRKTCSWCLEGSASWSF